MNENEVSDLPKKAYFGSLFLRRFFKYLLPLVLSLLLMTPLLAEAYRTTCDKSLETTQGYAEEALRQLEEQILASQELSSFFLNERTLLNVMLAKGELQPGDYIYLNQIQSQLARLNLTKTGAAEIFLLFRDNDSFISNYISSDDFRTVYPRMLEYPEMTAEQYRQELMSERFSVRLLPQHDIYSRYYGNGIFSGITCIVNNSLYDSIRPSSVLVSIIDCEMILGGFFGAEQREENLIWLADRGGNLLMAHNTGMQPMPASGQSRTAIDGRDYLLVERQSSTMGLQMMVGIPLRQFYRDLLPMIQVVLLYSVIGLALALGLSIIFSLREASSMSGLVRTAAATANADYRGVKNEITFVSSAIRQMGDTNARQLQRINVLHDSIRICALENLLMMGVYTQKEEAEVLRFFDRDFSFYCVLKCRVLPALENENCRGQEQAVLLELQHDLSNLFSAPPLILNLYDGEFAALVFLDGEDSSNLEPFRERLTETVRAASSEYTVFHMGMSTITTGIRNVRGAYLQACHAINLHADARVSGVYRYEAPRTRSGPIGFDLAILFKLYDVVVNGDAKAVDQIFGEILRSITVQQLSQLEQAQLFFTVRQAVYNAYVEALRSCPEEEGFRRLTYPDFRPDIPLAEQLGQLHIIANTICGVIVNSRRSSAQRIKDEVENYVREHYSDPGLCAELIAQELLISEKYVFAIIKERTGRSLGHFIEDIRISHAEKLLRETGESNAKISLLCGFGSENTFYRAFSRCHGVSPSVWRKNQE